MIFSNFLSRMEEDKREPQQVIPISFDSHSILKRIGHYYIYSILPLETYAVVTRSHTKAVGTQMPKVHRAHEVVGSELKPETQARREGFPKLMPVIPKSISQPQRIVPPALPRKEQGRSGARRNIIIPKLQPIPHHTLVLHSHL